jgi:hypothetical protein
MGIRCGPPQGIWRILRHLGDSALAISKPQKLVAYDRKFYLVFWIQSNRDYCFLFDISIQNIRRHRRG